MELAGKRALITGGTKGIGAALAIDLARQGCDVAINGRFDDDEAAQVRKEIENMGRRCAVALADMAVPDDVKRCVDKATAALGGLDILVHCAGGAAWGNIEDCAPETWYHAFDVHVHAAYHLCREALPQLRKRGEGAILLVSSVAGIRGVPSHLAYATVKGAIVQFTRCLARDLADDNIRVNCIAPGVILTRFHDAMTEEAKDHNLNHRIPLRRFGKVDDVAEVGRMLIANDYMTGETVVVDGGLSMQISR